MSDLGKRQSRQARNYGHKAEMQIIDRYDLEIEHQAWMDARHPDGDPVEIKAAKRKLSNGRTGRILIRKRPHQQLRQRDGDYAIAVYRPRGSGIEMLRTEMIPARSLRIDSWQDLENRDDEKQITITEIIQ